MGNETNEARVRDYPDKSVCAKRLGFDDQTFRNIGAEVEVLPCKGWREAAFAHKLFKAAPSEFQAGDFVLKRDVSLTDGFGYWAPDGDYQNLQGLEIVTGVMGPSYVQTYDWDGMFSILGQCCHPISPELNVGLHIHADRRWGCPAGVENRRGLAMVATYLVDTMSGDEVRRVFGRTSQYAKSAPIFRTLKSGVSLYSSKAKSLLYAAFLSTDSTYSWQYRQRVTHCFMAVADLSARQLRDERVYSAYFCRSERNQLVNVENKDTLEFRGFLSPRTAAKLRYAQALVTAMMDFASTWVYSRDKRLPDWEYFLEVHPRFGRVGFASPEGEELT